METNSPEDEPTPDSPPAAPDQPIPVEPPAPAEPEAPVVPESLAEIFEPEPQLEPVAASEETPPEDPPVETGESEEPSEPSESVEPDELVRLAEASQKARLSPADEERMGTLLKEALLGGRAGVARAVDVLPKVPWIVGVRAVEGVWPDLTAGFRTQLLAGLAKEETDAARRIRLSLARALFKIDMPVALKLAVGVARELRDKETGTLTPKAAQIFANVFIGRGKPWLAQLPVADLKPAEVDALVHCAVLSVFLVPHPPVTQLGVLKWVQEQGRMAKLDAPALEAAKKGVTRWSGKWQGALRKEVAELPEDLLAVLKPAPEANNPEAPARDEATSESSRDEGASSGSPKDLADDDEDEDEDDDDKDEEDEDEEDEKERRGGRGKERPVYEPRPQKQGGEESGGDSRKDRPVYTPRNQGGGGGNVPRNFNLTEALRNIEAYAQSLRNEVAAAQAKSRQREERPKREEKVGAIIPGEPTPEELARLNLQLEARNNELQERIKELAEHSEDVAVSSGVMAGEPIADGAAQLRTLLALKLQEDFADFLALEKESNDLVIQQHYRGLIRHVFEVLQQLEVPLTAEPPAA